MTIITIIIIVVAIWTFATDKDADFSTKVINILKYVILPISALFLVFFVIDYVRDNQIEKQRKIEFVEILRVPESFKGSFQYKHPDSSLAFFAFDTIRVTSNEIIVHLQHEFEGSQDTLTNRDTFRINKIEQKRENQNYIELFSNKGQKAQIEYKPEENCFDFKFHGRPYIGSDFIKVFAKKKRTLKDLIEESKNDTLTPSERLQENIKKSEQLQRKYTSPQEMDSLMNLLDSLSNRLNSLGGKN